MKNQLFINMQLKAKGFFRLQTFQDGRCTKDTGFFENLITNLGLDLIGNSTYVGSFSIPFINTKCSVGTGNTPPTFSDTQLTSFLAQSPGNIEGAQNNSYTAGPPTYWSQIWTYTFPTGSAAGNLSEVGVGVPGTLQPNLFSHALIVDGSGNPTTITVTSSEVLVVTYELRLYPDTTDNSYSFSLNGTITESGIYRPGSISAVPNFARDVSNRGTGSTIFFLCNGAIQPITGFPANFEFAGTGRTGTSLSTNSYIAGTYFRQYTATFGTTAARGTIITLALTTNLGAWQFSVSPSIAFTTGFSLQVSFSISWTRF